MACLHGDYAVATIAGASAASMFDWEFDYDTDYVDGSAYGDFWEYPQALRSRWRFRAKAYVTANQAATFLSDGWNSAADPGSVVLTGYSGAAGLAKIFEGTGKPSRGSLTAPDAATSVQEVEFVGYGPPTTGI